jgi:hypothetical protein
MGMSISVISSYLAAVPRLIWPCVITAIYIPLAIVGADSFATTLNDFLSILGYWLAIFATIVLEEHFLFRKANYDNYNVAESWNRKEMVPLGVAAIAAGCAGVAGAVLGMAQVWYTGPSKFWIEVTFGYADDAGQSVRLLVESLEGILDLSFLRVSQLSAIPSSDILSSSSFIDRAESGLGSLELCPYL